MKKAIIGIVAFAATAFGLSAVFNAQDQYTCQDVTVTVTSGDTLWSIAEGHCSGEIRAAVHDLVAQYGNQINPGMEISFSKKGSK